MKNVVLHNIINVHLNYKYAFNCMLLNVLIPGHMFLLLELVSLAVYIGRQTVALGLQYPLCTIAIHQSQPANQIQKYKYNNCSLVYICTTVDRYILNYNFVYLKCMYGYNPMRLHISIIHYG